MMKYIDFILRSLFDSYHLFGHQQRRPPERDNACKTGPGEVEVVGGTALCQCACHSSLSPTRSIIPFFH